MSSDNDIRPVKMLSVTAGTAIPEQTGHEKDRVEGECAISQGEFG